ncbi:MAG: PepSY-associated TM helix domain-containing protein [Phycisphaerae bacterium]|nr:PepSY-associated TM helix domain-containing protein [Tepidisphaeraceae bacterium]
MRINRTLLHWSRTLHIYLTMLALAAMLFFAVTGFTAHHEDWFGATDAKEGGAVTGTVPAELLASGSDLALIDYVRKTYGAAGSGINFNEQADDITIAYKRPGAEWTATIRKPGGEMTLTKNQWNAVAVINDLHRGRNGTGPAWGWVIDVSAGLIVLACATGVVLWLALPKRRKWGVVYMVLGTAALVGVYVALLPAPDEHVSAPRGKVEK